MKKLLAIIWLTVSFAYAQDQSTPNQITSGTNHTWTGTNTAADPGGCCAGGPGALYDPSTNIIHFSYGQATAAQTFAINQAFANSGAGIQITGYNYSWDIKNNAQNGADPLSISVLTWNYNNTIIRRTDTWNYTATHDWTTYSGNVGYNSPGPVSDFGNLTVKMTSYDRGFWAGYYGPKVRNVNIGMTYSADQCAADPLSNTSCAGYANAYLNLQCSGNALYSPQCPGYAAAYFTQQCTVNALSDPSCPGYAASYLTYQCSINPLYATTCTGYDQAYLNQQCGISPLYSQSCSGYSVAYRDSQCRANPLYDVNCTGYTSAYHDQQCSTNPLYATTCVGYASAYLAQQCATNGLYSTSCPNYSTAYAKKMLLEQQGLASTVATAGTVAKTAEIANANTSSSSTSDGSSSVAIAVVADPLVNAAVTSTATSTSPASAATATVSLAPTPPAPPPPAGEPKQDKKPEGTQQAAGPQPQGGQGGDKPQASARQALVERRAEAAKKDAVEKGKNLANEMGKAADMESQKQVQNVVIQAMGFTPGFDAYGKSIVPDVVGYRPFTVYNNQKIVDNRRLGVGLYGPSDRLHNDLIESQYKGN